MNNYNLILSNEKFKQQQFMTVKNAVESKINAFYKNKENSRRISLATSGFWCSFAFMLLGFIWLIITIGLNIYTTLKLKQNDWLYDHQKPFFWSFYIISIAMFLSSGIAHLIAKREKTMLEKDVISSFNNRDITDYLFRYFGLTPKYNTDEIGKNIISYNVINFYKNIHNFRDLSTYNLTLGKYEMYEASTVNQFFKMQNLLYVDNSWVDTTDLDKKTLRSLYRMNASTYKNKIELDERKLRFGIATRIGNINKDFNITLFDNNDCFTAPELKLIALDKEYESIVLNAIDNQLLRNWLKDENNLKYIKDLRNQITSLKINNPVAKRRSNKSLVKNLSLVLRNQEAFIWFDTNCELLDVAYITKTLNPKNIIDAITNKLLDDFYLIYLVIQLLAPFGLDLTLKISEKEVNEVNEVDVRPNDDFANVSEPVSPTATTSVK